MRFQAPRGTEDVLPLDAPKWHRVESVFHELTRKYGYQELRTPTFEDTEIFSRTSGETSDIVSKEMYTFTDKGGRSITLKPEGTAPAMRAVIEHSLCPPGTLGRFMYITPCFRYNRPGKGRLRELHQLGLELVGSSSPAADAEIIEVTYRFFEACGIRDVRVHINSIGREACRARYRDVVLSHLAGYLCGLSDDAQAQARKNPLRLLDSKDPEARVALEGLAPILDYLEEDSAANFARLKELLSAAGVPFEVRPEIVRGLDYYTETVFEMFSGDDPSSLCGGGRYDNLARDLGGTPTPSVGVGIGVERTLLAMAESGVSTPGPVLDAFLVQAAPEAYLPSLDLARTLRAAGFAVLVDIDGRSMKSQLRQADKSGARHALILGTEELAKGTVQAKTLATGEQVELVLSDVGAFLRERQ